MFLIVLYFIIMLLSSGQTTYKKHPVVWNFMTYENCQGWIPIQFVKRKGEIGSCCLPTLARYYLDWFGFIINQKTMTKFNVQNVQNKQHWPHAAKANTGELVVPLYSHGSLFTQSDSHLVSQSVSQSVSQFVRQTSGSRCLAWFLTGWLAGSFGWSVGYLADWVWSLGGLTVTSVLKVKS